MDAVLLRILDDDAADLLARRLMADVNGSDLPAEASLARRGAEAGEKGVIESVGSVLLTIVQVQGIEHLVAMLRDLVSGDLAAGAGQRAIEMTFPDGHTIKLEGRMTDDQFARISDRLIRMAESGSGHAPA